AEPLVLRGHDDGVLSAAFSADGTRIVSASSDKTLRIWNADGSGEPIVLRTRPGTTQALTGLTVSVVWTPDGEHLLFTVDDTLRIWNTDGRGQEIVLRGHSAMVESAVYSPD